MVKTYADGNDKALCNYYQSKSITSSTTQEGFYLNGTTSEHKPFIRIRYGTEDTASNFKTWLSTHNLIIYCLLYEATDTEITNETLIEQLDNLEKLKSYNGTTNISSSGSLPMILNISAIKGE